MQVRVKSVGMGRYATLLHLVRVTFLFIFVCVYLQQNKKKAKAKGKKKCHTKTIKGWEKPV